MPYKFIILIFLSLLPLLKSRAQTTVVNDIISGTHFQAAIGFKYQQADFAALNQSLAAADFPALSENMNAIGFLTNRISNRWMFSLKTFYTLPNEVASDGKEIEYRNQQYALGAGYNILQGNKLKLLPTVAATLGRNVLLIQDKSSSSPNFQDLLQSPDQEADLRNFAYVADLGLALHYQFFRKTRQKALGPKASWFPLVIKAGYQFQLGASDFKFDGKTIAGVPEIAMEGFYASVFIGFGSKMLAGK